jgi:leucyl-tRNA synthetase
MIAYLSQKNLGERKINYKLRDWVFSRQRYWGEPIPLLHTHDGKIVPLSPSELPLLLPETDSYQPSDDGQSPLANIPSFINREFYYDENGDARFVSLNNPAPEGKEVFQGKLETLTMPNWAGSSWYYLRYMDPYNENEFVSKEAEQYFQSVDMYIGGAEHAVLHLLYARFWHKVLFDLGLVSQKEPFLGLKNVGMILSFGYKNEFGKYYHISEVEEKNGEFFAKEDGKKLERNIEKMSKSKYNVVNPDDVVNQYGADTLRLYEMFMGPFDQTVVWDEKGIVGVYRFLEKLWSLLSLVCEESPEEAELRLLHQAIQKISSDTDNFKFNTAISHAMITVNEFLKRKKITKESLLEFITLLSPYIPHITDEMAEILGHTDSLAFRPYPHHDEKYCTASLLRLAIQVNGKVRGEIEVSLEDSEESIIKKAQEVESVKKYLVSGYSQVRYVRGRIVSFVV